MLASLLFPYDEDAGANIDAWMHELERENMVRRYIVNGDTYLEICNWLKHQKIDKPSKSKIPPFDESSRILANPRERSSGDRDQGPRTKDQGSLPTAPQSAEMKLDSEPVPEEPKPKKQRTADPLFDALATACGSNPRELTTTAARGCAIALADIRKVAPELTAAELTRRAENYRLHFPDAACTVFAIAKHWAQCGERPAPRSTTTQRPNQNPNYGTKCELAFFPQ